METLKNFLAGLLVIITGIAISLGGIALIVYTPMLALILGILFIGVPVAVVIGAAFRGEA